MYSLQQTYNELVLFAREKYAEVTMTTILTEKGAELHILWEGQDVPKEAVAAFGKEGVSYDSFLVAFVIDPKRFMNAIEEGCNDDIAQEHATIAVDSIEDLKNYLIGKPYKKAFVNIDKI